MELPHVQVKVPMLINFLPCFHSALPENTTKLLKHTLFNLFNALIIFAFYLFANKIDY